MQDFAHIVDSEDLLPVLVAEAGQRPPGLRQVRRGDQQVDVGVAAVLARRVERPSEGRALEQQGIDADGLEGGQRLHCGRVEQRLVAEPAGTLHELVELGARTHVRVARRQPAGAEETSANAEA